MIISRQAFDDVLYGMVVPAVKPVQLVGYATGTGNLDLYTVPTGKIAWLRSIGGYFGVGSSNLYPQVKVSSTYYQIAATTVGAAFGWTTLRLVLSEGHILSLNTDTAVDVYSATVFEMDVANNPFVPFYNWGIGTSDSTLYTCPTGKVAAVMSPTIGLTDVNDWAFTGQNESGGTRSWSGKFKPSGGSSVLVRPALSVGNHGQGVLNGYNFILQPGDAIVISSSSATAGQYVWGCVAELDLSMFS